MNLVDKEDDVRIVPQLPEDGTNALLELPPVFRAGDNGAHVERNDALVEEGSGGAALNDPEGETFDDSAFPDSRLTDEHGVVFLPSAEDLGDALYLCFAPDDRIELSFGSRQSHVDAEIVKHGRIAVRVCCGGVYGGMLGTSFRSVVLGGEQQVVVLIFLVEAFSPIGGIVSSYGTQGGDGGVVGRARGTLFKKDNGFLARAVVGDTQLRQYFGCCTVSLFQNGKQQMDGSYAVGLVQTSLDLRDFQDLIGSCV